MPSRPDQAGMSRPVDWTGSAPADSPRSGAADQLLDPQQGRREGQGEAGPCAPREASAVAHGTVGACAVVLVGRTLVTARARGLLGHAVLLAERRWQS